MARTSSRRTSQLAVPPIVEMVLDIDCDLGPDSDVLAAAAAVRPALAQHYLVETKQYAENYVIERSGEGTQISPSARAIQSVRFHAQDKTQLVQVRAAGYSFNRLAPYEGFDRLQSEIARTWQIYCEHIQPLAIRRTSLRYINRIVVPHEDQRVDLQRYFKTGPRLPAKGLVSTGFLLQNNAVDAKTQHEVVTVLASHGNATPAEFAFLLDISVASNHAMPADEAALLWHALGQLRKLKNEVFRSMVTRQCLQLFQ